MRANFLNNAVNATECYTSLKTAKICTACTKICDIACLNVVLCADRVFQKRFVFLVKGTMSFTIAKTPIIYTVTTQTQNTKKTKEQKNKNDNKKTQCFKSLFLEHITNK